MNPPDTSSAVQYEGDLTADGIKPFRVAAPDGLDTEALDTLRQHQGIEVVNELSAAQAAIIRSATKFPKPEDLHGKYADDPDAHDFKDIPHLGLVVRGGDGHDNIDKIAATEHGVATVNTPGVSSRDVALHATTFIHAWERRILDGSRSLQRHEFDKKGHKPRDLENMTLVIIGHGNIGTEVKNMIGDSFGSVKFFDLDPELTDSDNLGDLLETADVVAIHVSGKAQILTPEMFARMQNTKLIVNTSRGTNIDTPELLEWLNREGADATYATDVFTKEPIDFADAETGDKGDPIETTLVDHPNVYGTPHIAASRIGNQRAVARKAVEHVLQFATNGTVNPDNIKGHTFPRVALNERDVPGIRGIVLHENVPAKLQAIDSVLGEEGLNVRAQLNDHSRINGETLAMTQFDFESDVTPEEAVRVMQRIAEASDAIRTRLLSYVKAE